MGLRPGHCYSDIKADRAYTRIAIQVPDKNFIGTNPPLRIRQFNMGNPIKDFQKVIDVCSEKSCQIRDNALEAVRTSLNRNLIKKIGKENFFLKLRVYPFHILRENKQAQGAGADRVSQGMSHAFGRPIGRATRVKKGQVLLSILVDEKQLEEVKKLIKRVKGKLPCPIRLKIHSDIKSIGTRPRITKIEEEKVEEKEVKEEEKAKVEEKEAEKAKETEKTAEKTPEKAKK